MRCSKNAGSLVLPPPTKGDQSLCRLEPLSQSEENLGFSLGSFSECALEEAEARV